MVWSIMTCLLLIVLIAIAGVFILKLSARGAPTISFGEIAALGLASVFLIVWLSIWTGIGIFDLHALLWQAGGQEVIRVSANSIQLTQRIFSWGFPREYLAEHITNLRLVRRATFSFPAFIESLRGWTNSAIAFDCGTRTVTFARSADEPEARQILSEIQKRFLQYPIPPFFGP